VSRSCHGSAGVLGRRGFRRGPGVALLSASPGRIAMGEQPRSRRAVRRCRRTSAQVVLAVASAAAAADLVRMAAEGTDSNQPASAGQIVRIGLPIRPDTAQCGAVRLRPEASVGPATAGPRHHSRRRTIAPAQPPPDVGEEDQRWTVPRPRSGLSVGRSGNVRRRKQGDHPSMD